MRCIGKSVGHATVIEIIIILLFVFVFFVINSTDYNECLVDNGSCEQICTNEIPGYNCSCRDGFTLNVNQTTCDGRNNHYYCVKVEH